MHIIREDELNSRSFHFMDIIYCFLFVRSWKDATIQQQLANTLRKNVPKLWAARLSCLAIEGVKNTRNNIYEIFYASGDYVQCFETVLEKAAPRRSRSRYCFCCKWCWSVRNTIAGERSSKETNKDTDITSRQNCPIRNCVQVSDMGGAVPVALSPVKETVEELDAQLPAVISRHERL